LNVVNKITQSADRTTTPEMVDVAIDLAGRPLGRVAGDPTPGVAFNLRPANAVYHARNVSSLYPRALVLDSVSAPEEVPVSDKLRELFPGVDAQTMKKNVNTGRARYEDISVDLHPVHQVVTFDGKDYLLKAAENADHTANIGQPGEWTLVPEGLIDINLGNPDRLAGYDGDPEHKRKPDLQIAKAEKNRVAELAGGRPMFFWEGDDQGKDPKGRPWAFIEVRKEEMETVALAIDAKQIRAGMKIQR
jgi:hypothetical protein